MASNENESVVRLESAQAVIRNHFLGWQCRLRQHAMRHLQGQPSQGLCPDLLLRKAGKVFEGASVILVPRHPQTTIAELKHMVKKTHDPGQRYKSALTYFSASYYQDPSIFSDRMAALFGPSSSAATALLNEGQCELRFREKNQSYILPSEVREIPRNDPAWNATFWHNSLFNPNIPGNAVILGFTPDWALAEADPPAY
ncbi:MAG: hypothetical protein R3245_11150 [Kiloniellales bacterium]|nr:hypothetical protein [Kiloniellales bacterium]